MEKIKKYLIERRRTDKMLLVGFISLLFIGFEFQNKYLIMLSLFFSIMYILN